jgi:hypothetical protein
MVVCRPCGAGIHTGVSTTGLRGCCPPESVDSMSFVVPSSRRAVAATINATIKKMLRSHRSCSRRGGQKVFDHPVRASSKDAFGDIFPDSASTPPLEEGATKRIHSAAPMGNSPLGPWLALFRRFAPDPTPRRAVLIGRFAPDPTGERCHNLSHGRKPVVSIQRNISPGGAEQRL